MKQIYFLSLMLITLFSNQAFSQSGTIVTGNVLDENSGPLTGVTVVAINATDTTKKEFTSTNANGVFRFSDLAANKSYTFRFTYVGYEPQSINNFSLKPGENAPIIVKMQTVATVQLDDVVVVGYGTQQKENLTGAVNQVKGDDFRDRPVTNISSMLQGAVPNLNIRMGGGVPGQMGSLNVRGLTSISSGSNPPLVLIDGIPGTLDRLSPEEIQSITVLKDASSAAIYGARGAFGVVLVTTKSGSSGKTAVRYNNSFGFATPTVSTDFMTSGYDWMSLHDRALAHVGGYSGYTEADYAELYARRNDKVEDPSRPWVTVQNRNGREQYVYYGNYDWWDIMFNKWQGITNHNLNISGGSEKVTFMINGNRKSMDGIMRIQPDNYQSNAVRSKVTAKLYPWLKISNNTNFYNSIYDYHGREDGGNANYIHINVHGSPAYAPINPDGTASYRSGLNNYDIGDGIFAMLIDGKTKGSNRKYELTTTNEFVLTPINNLNITGNYSYSLYTDPSFYRQVPAKYSLTPGVIEVTPKYSVDQLSEYQQFNQVHVYNLFGDYAKSFNDVHNFKILVGYNFEMRKSKRTTARRMDLSSEDLNDLNLGTGDQFVFGGSSNYSLEGYFYRFNYNYKGKYLLEANGRYDGSSRFPEGQRYGFFPSGSAGWRISEESFFEPLKNTINELKIRGSVGQLGNQNVSSPYPYVLTMSPGTMSYILDGERARYYNDPSPVSGDLTWERVTSYNLGVDVGLLSNRLTLAYDQYIRDTKGMLSEGLDLPGAYGASAPLMNVADLRTKGFEVSIQWRDMKMVGGKPMRYNVAASIGDNSSVITKIMNDTKQTFSLYEGKKYGEIWGYITDGYFKTDAEAKTYPVDQTWLNKVRIDNNIPIRAGDLRWVDLNGDNKISAGANTIFDPGDQRVIGNSTPRYQYSFNAGVNWNNFDFSLFFQGLGKMDYYPSNNADRFWGPYSRPYFSFIPKDFESKIWSPENPDAYFPSLMAYVALNGNNELRATNNKYLQDLAYLRLKNVSLGYMLPQHLTRKIKINTFRVFVSGENVLTWTKFQTKYIDPEQAMADGNGRVYPFNKTYSFGFDITF
ncbi:MAG: TonB-dependent receptor [Ginsengibacter sp.]